MKKTLLILIILTLSITVFSEELYRIRIENSQNGLVQVSLDEGENYSCIGRVVHPANKCGVGFMASGYIEGGTVCATASHAIRIKIAPKSKYNLDFKSIPIFSILPKEFWTTPKGFGGHVAQNSGIYTDIHTAQGIFLNFAPFPETKVYEEFEGKLYTLNNNHIPKIGNVYVIPVNAPNTNLEYIDFKNVPGGNVTINSKELLTKVFTPVSAIGRYDATTYNSPGQLNTCHGGVITIATSKLFPYSQKEGDKPETRGGFMIQPVYHAIRQGEKKPQVMTIGLSTNNFEQEGQAPLYSSCMNLWYYQKHPESSYYAQLEIDNEKYINMPTLTGRIDNGLTKEYLNKYLKLNCKIGVTGVRLHIPKYNKELGVEYLNRLRSEYNSPLSKSFDTGEYFTPSISIPHSYGNCSYFVDGKMKGITSEVEKIKIFKGDFVSGLHHFQVTVSKNGENFNFSEYFFVK